MADNEEASTATGEIIIQDGATNDKYALRLDNGVLRLVRVDDGAETTDIGVSTVSSNWPSVSPLVDGEDVRASTFNRPIRELVERTNYLHDKLDVFDRYNPLAAVTVRDVPLADDGVDAGDIVFLDSRTKTYGKALATVDLLDSFSASGSSYAVGMLHSKTGSRGNVVLFGKADLTGSRFDLSRMVEDGETFRDGMYFLSGRQPGRITAYPSGLKVSVGHFFRKNNAASSRVDGDFAIIHVEARDFAEAHVHRAYELSCLPAGEQSATQVGEGGTHVFSGYSPDAVAAGAATAVKYVARLVFTGEYLERSDCKYSFVLGGYSGPDASVQSLEFGQVSGVFLHWSNETSGTSGRIEFTAFKQPKEIENGILVELRPDPSLSSATSVVYELENGQSDSASYRTWSSGMTFPDAGRGWRDLTDAELARFTVAHTPKFVYNIGFDRALQTYYPPVPLKSASLLLDGVELPAAGLGGDYVYSLEYDSIYWYDDSYGNAPWPVDFSSRGASGAGSRRSLVLRTTSSTSSESGPVTSLRARDGSGIRVLRCGSEDPSFVGDLELDFDPTGGVEDAAVEGYSVVKEGADGKFLKGPVVERVLAGPGITVSRFGSDPQGQGTVIVSSKEGGAQGDFEEIVLQNAKQDLVGMFPYVRLLGWSSGQTNVGSAFILKLHVPYDNPDFVYRVGLSGSVFGTSGYSGGSLRYAGLQIRYSILPDLNPTSSEKAGHAAANVKDDLIEPDGIRPVEVPIVSSMGVDGCSYKAFDPVYVHTVPVGDDSSEDVFGKSYSSFGTDMPDPNECSSLLACGSDYTAETLGVRPGYTVAIKITRGPTVSGVSEYTGEVGFMNLRWELKRVS